ncbi:MAG: hypothetical protein LUF00_10230 [Lachnospiraceae bacterium]|nr:hypothetical protein [Lachnospiraceae bacterium]
MIYSGCLALLTYSNTLEGRNAIITLTLILLFVTALNFLGTFACMIAAGYILIVIANAIGYGPF